jgi:phosphoadenosine phosphosulfate reductase
MTSPQRFGFSDIADLKEAAGSATGTDLLGWAHERFATDLVIASSLGPEDVAIIHMIHELGLSEHARVFTLDTGRLHEPTYTLMDTLRERYGMNFEVYHPDAHALEQLTRAKGMHSFYESIDARKECCHIRKVEPLKRVLSTASAWVTGIRREQNVTRVSTENVELDLANGGLLKINPLVDWTRDQLWDYIKTQDIPYNPLHDKGFASIGCAPCTRAIEPGEDERAGRWSWENPDQRECGLHPAK